MSPGRTMRDETASLINQPHAATVSGQYKTIMESSQTKSSEISSPKEAVGGNPNDSSQKPIEQLEQDIQSKLSISQDPEQNNSEQIQQMSHDFVHLTHDPLLALQTKLFELQQAQLLLMNTINAENQKAANLPDMTPLIETMSKVPIYKDKIVNIRRGMIILSDRVGKLKRRTQKLQERKMQDEMAAAERKQRELERERKLTAQPSRSLLEREQTKKQNESWPTATVSDGSNNTNYTSNNNNSNNNPPVSNIKGQ